MQCEKKMETANVAVEPSGDGAFVDFQQKVDKNHKESRHNEPQ